MYTHQLPVLPIESNNNLSMSRSTHFVSSGAYGARSTTGTTSSTPNQVPLSTGRLPHESHYYQGRVSNPQHGRNNINSGFDQDTDSDDVDDSDDYSDRYAHSCW